MHSETRRNVLPYPAQSCHTQSHHHVDNKHYCHRMWLKAWYVFDHRSLRECPDACAIGTLEILKGVRGSARATTCSCARLAPPGGGDFCNCIQHSCCSFSDLLQSRARTQNRRKTAYVGSSKRSIKDHDNLGAMGTPRSGDGGST